MDDITIHLWGSQIIVCALVNMEHLLEVVRAHKVKATRRRVNVSQGAETVLYGKTRWLKEPLRSESITEGPVMDAARATLPDFEFTHIQLNKNLVCSPHKDGRNRGESLILFLGEYTGGELFWERSLNITYRSKILHNFLWGILAQKTIFRCRDPLPATRGHFEVGRLSKKGKNHSKMSPF